MSHLRPVDVCVIVKDIFKTIEDVGISVTAPVLLKELLVPAVAAKNGRPDQKFTINLRPKKWDKRYVAGMLLRYDDHADIIYSMDQSTCWRRFVVCKELAHLLIDTEAEHFTQDTVSLVQELIN